MTLDEDAVVELVVGGRETMTDEDVAEVVIGSTATALDDAGGGATTVTVTVTGPAL